VRAEPPPRALEVTIGPAMPVPDNEDVLNTLRDRYWFVQPEISVRLNQRCRDLQVRTATPSFTDRTARRRAFGDVEDGYNSSHGAHPAGFVFVERGDAYSAWGNSIRFTAHAKCRRPGGGIVRGSATRWFDMPDQDCRAGGPRVFEARRAGGLAEGSVLTPGDELRIAPGGLVVAGLPECNAYAVTLGPGRHTVGGYDPEGRGGGSTGTSVAAIGDEHAGGASVAGRLNVEPLTLHCRECAPLPSAYEVRAQGARRVTVRVADGTVMAAAPGVRPIRVPAGFQADAVCEEYRSCTVSRRLFQPDEPWSSPVTPPAGFRPEAVSRAGARPPRSSLAPPYSRVWVRILRAAGGAPEQILVRWNRELRHRGGGFAGDLRRQQGVLVWEGARRGAFTRWRVVYSRRFRPWDSTFASTGDVTGDGHPDALLEQVMGSGACGPHIVVGQVRGRVRTLFRRDTCETSMGLARGALVIDEPVGPCPYEAGSAHCFGGRRVVVMRWNGSKLVPAETTVECAFPRLDPARECT
jgi:hypothetical protein